MVIKDATQQTPLAHDQNSFFKCKQHTVHDPGGQEQYNYTTNNSGSSYEL